VHLSRLFLKTKVRDYGAVATCSINTEKPDGY